MTTYARESGYIYDESFSADADLSAKQFYAVKRTATGVALCAATDTVLGILQNKPKAGEAATVRLLGLSKAVSDGSGTAIAAGDFVGPSAAGLMVKKATADYSLAGIADAASSAASTVISVFVRPGFFRTAAG